MSSADVKLEPRESDDGDSSSSSSPSQRDKKSRSRQRAASSSGSCSSGSEDWIDDEDAAGASPASRAERHQESKDSPARSRPKRSKPPYRFTTSSDYNRFDRPDMYVNDLFSYMGMFLAPDPRRKPEVLEAFDYRHCATTKIVRLSVEGGVMATGPELFNTLQKAILENSEDQSKLPSTMNLRGQSLALDYSPPHGDEICFGAHTQDCKWIGPNFLGSVLISPSVSKPAAATQMDLSQSHAWRQEWSYRTWHQASLPGVLHPAPTLPALPRRRRPYRSANGMCPSDTPQTPAACSGSVQVKLDHVHREA